ncbi:MAG: hypothetical protein U0R19_05445 [Bryobacteraceae bacterium]
MGIHLHVGYSRMMVAEAALDQKLGTLLRMHEEAFRQLGGVPEEILYDRMKWCGWRRMNVERLCGTLCFWTSPDTGASAAAVPAVSGANQGQSGIGVKYVRRNFLCGLQGREPNGLEDLNAQLREWCEGGHQRIHGTTHESVALRGEADQFSLQLVEGHSAYPYLDQELRKVARDAFRELAREPVFGSLAVCGQASVGQGKGRRDG